jgi:methionyl aminopeptidase
VTVETEEELQALRKIGRIVADCLQVMSRAMEPGMTTKELDDVGAAYLAKHGARSAPQLTYDFPGATCISVGHHIAHGIPGSNSLAAGDLVNIDVSAELNGFFADTGGSFSVPPIKPEHQRVCRGTREALAKAMKEARAGRPLNVIGKAIEGVAAKHGLSIIRNLGSHGVGRGLHEEPGFIAPFYSPKDKRILKDGLVITIEPFLSTGATEVEEADDGWTLYHDRRYVSAQYEHTLVITKGMPLVMTMPSA